MGVLEDIRKKSPLVHCITNPISMMQCANACLGLGAKPIMAEHPREVKDITASADALLLNLGNISDTRMEAMEISFETALEKDIPVVIDAVGVACSSLRREFVYKLLGKKHSGDLVIKGNYSEIKALYDEGYKGRGVDSEKGLSMEEIVAMARDLAIKHGLVILGSGERDFVTDGKRTVIISNGVKELGTITGTGCMLGTICTSFLSISRGMDTVVKACAFMGIAGERALQRAVGSSKGVNDGRSVGSGSFLIALLDEIALLTDEDIDADAKIAEA